MRSTYAVRVQRSGDWWAIDVPEIRGVHSQARRLDRVEYMTRDAIALWFEVPEDSFDLEVHVELPPTVREVVDAVDAARERSSAAQREESDRILARNAHHWDLSRLALVDRNILRLAVAEMRGGQTPPKVALSEAIRLAQEFSSAESPRFVNGVLDAVMKEILASRRSAAELVDSSDEEE